jgi:NAD(P)-dependent dehydrogenase (short-subunit alcohol dehydrogenase family)
MSSAKDGRQAPRVALVTGGTRGIGLAIARALAHDGWHLALCGVRRPDEVAAVVEQLRSTGVDVHYSQADVAESHARARLVAEAGEALGPINALVNNAGRAPRVRADLLDATEDSFEDLLRTNLTGPYFLTQSIARHMVKQKSADPHYPAAVVFITSVSAELASANRGDYCVSKAGLSMAARLFALRLAPVAIPVFEVRPGIIETDMTAGVREAYDRRIANGLIPEGRWGRAEDVGQAVATLLRGDIPYATGTVIQVDGGLSLPRL